MPHRQPLPSNNTPLPRRASSIREPQRFGRNVEALARFMAGAPADSLAFLIEVDRRWPGLSFRDFMAATVLAEALVMKCEGTA